ncbi:concanavalin A-like lectin/glucanase domain-containing protein [Dichomitus squalens]|uniref:Concanavalin A-like lectin/glucanase domain-containing protein n=1 Tax=Dichomitus squalens TaxID=114155 RepID=A0A4Q9QD62_9APHY|nr:concanavalin A-like lectin/glucanase domain-containing protein [Dichomitus squalens]
MRIDVDSGVQTVKELGQQDLSNENVGTRLSSTRYIPYGTITARFRTGRRAGLVTVVITMSNIQDEIDRKLLSKQTTQGQSYYFCNYHDYMDTLTWLVDGQQVRQLKRSDVPSSDSISRYPSPHPASSSGAPNFIWPAGISTSTQGTIEWAGGLINWSDPDYQSTGHFYAFIESVPTVCADVKSNSANAQSYVYGKNASTFSPAVAVTNETTINGPAGADGVVAAGASGGVSSGFAMPYCSGPSQQSHQRMSLSSVTLTLKIALHGTQIPPQKHRPM